MARTGQCGRWRISLTVLTLLGCIAVSMLVPAMALGAQGHMMWWETKAPMPVAGRTRAIGAIAGQLYLLGGRNMGTRIDIYDPVSDVWTTPSYTLANPIGQSGSLVSAVRNGIMYTVDGTQLIGFDPTLPGPVKDWVVATLLYPVNGARGDIWNDTIYIFGGTEYLQAVDLSPNGQTGTVRVAASMPSARRFTPTFVADGYVYVCGGNITGVGGTDEVYRAAINTGLGTEGPLQPTTSFPVKRSGQSPQPFSNGRWYIATGLPYVDTLEFNATGPTWTVIGSVPTPRFTASAESYQDKLYTIGGADEADVDTNVNEVGHLEACTDIVADAHGVPAGGGTVNVTVDGKQVQLLFPSSQTEGPLTVATMTNPPSPFPGGFMLKGVIYEISSGALPEFPVDITLPYSGSKKPVIQHYTGKIDPGTGSPWSKTDTQVLSYGQGKVTFRTWSFSPFAVGEETETVSTPASSWWSSPLLVGLVVVSALFVIGRRWSASA